jgi:hypothetical protein
MKNPDGIVRRSPADPGTITEFKTLAEPTTSAVKRCVVNAAKQVAARGGGDVIIDGRAAGLDEATARQGYARAVGQARAHQGSLPRHVFVITPGDQLLELSQEGTP